MHDRCFNDFRNAGIVLTAGAFALIGAKAPAVFVVPGHVFRNSDYFFHGNNGKYGCCCQRFYGIINRKVYNMQGVNRMCSSRQMPEEKKQAVKRGYLCVEMILFACVLLMQTADLRKAEDVLIWLCIGINAVYMTAVSVSGLVRLIMLLTWFADTLLVLLDVCYTGGVLLFCCVQLLYALYLHRRGFGLIRIRFLLSAMLLAVYLTGLTGDSAPGETFYVVPALFSFSQLSANVLEPF